MKKALLVILGIILLVVGIFLAFSGAFEIGYGY